MAGQPSGPSDRVARYFRAGRLARAAQQIRLEALCAQLGMAPQEFLRLYEMPPAPPAPRDLVYLIADTDNPADGHPVKIGYTVNIKRRLYELQPGAVNRLVLLAFFRGGRELEAEIHGEFVEHRIREDWFRMCDQIREKFGLVGAAA